MSIKTDLFHFKVEAIKRFSENILKITSDPETIANFSEDDFHNLLYLLKEEYSLLVRVFQVQKELVHLSDWVYDNTEQDKPS